MKVLVRAYQIPRRRFHHLINRLPRWLHGFLDFPKEQVKG